MNRGEKAAEALGRGDPVTDEEAAFADFYDQISQAEGVAETEAVAAVRLADKGWQAHMTYLVATIQLAVAPAERRPVREVGERSGGEHRAAARPPGPRAG